MTLDVTSILDRIVSHALTLGVFDRVLQHEPKASPGTGVTAAVWADAITPIPAASGLAATSTRIVFKLRTYTSMLSEPQDAIDPAMLRAVDVLMAAYTGDFTLGGTVKQVDLLGAHGVALSAQAGYINLDGRLMRVYDCTLPIVVSDLWVQTA